MIVAEESIRKETGRVNTTLECWGFTNSPRYHTYRFQKYRNCHNKMYPGIAERAKK